MKPAGFVSTFLRLAVFSGVAFGVLWSVLFALTGGMDFGQVCNTAIWTGLLFGGLFGFIMAFFMKGEAFSVPVQDRGAFLTRLNTALAGIGYELESQTERFLTFRPTARAGILAGKVHVQMDPGSATIVGPSTHIKKLRMRI